MTPGSNILAGVIGAGSWGTALAVHLARSGVPTILYGRDAAAIARMAETECNARYLPDNRFPPSLEVTADVATAVSGATLVLVVTPSHVFGPVLDQVIPHMDEAYGLAWATKGFESGTGRLLHEVAAEKLGPGVPTAVVTGPSFAKEVAAGLPTAVTVASTHEEFADQVAATLHHGTFRCYTSQDMVGAELGGAVKNVLALATGVADGMGLGDNARAALITRGLSEMMRLGAAMGAEPETLTGLAGMGDLVLTATGGLSRNRRLGLALGQGHNLKHAQEEIGQVVEGVYAAREVMTLAKRYEVELPIARLVYAILFEDVTPVEGVKALLARDMRPEFD